MNDISKMPRIAAPISDSEADALDAGVLAFVGDAVQTLAVRTRLALSMGTKSGEMHRAQIREVSAEAQAKAFRNIEKLLSEEETRVYKRSRNTPHLFVQAHRRIRLYRGYYDYIVATGLEGLIGYLYLTGKNERLTELINAAYFSANGEEGHRD